MGATLSSIAAALKQTWTSTRLEEQLYTDHPTLDKIVKETPEIQVGSGALTPIHVSRNAGYTAFDPNNSSLNAAGQQGLAQATWQYSHHGEAIRIEGSALDGSQNNTVAIAQALDIEVTGALENIGFQATRQLFGAGDGHITACATTTASTTLHLNPADGHNAIERGWLAVGSTIDIGAAATPTSVASARTITAVNDSLTDPTVVISGAAVTAASTDFVTWQNSNSGSTTREMNGLDNLVSLTADFGGLTVAAQPTWKAASVDSTSTNISLDNMTAAQMAVYQKRGKVPSHIVIGVKQLRKFYLVQQSQVRFGSDTAISAGGVLEQSWQGSEIVVDPACKNERVYHLTLADIFILRPKAPYWKSDVTGTNGLADVQGTDAYADTLIARLNLGARRRDSHASLTTLG